MFWSLITEDLIQESIDPIFTHLICQFEPNNIVIEVNLCKLTWRKPAIKAKLCSHPVKHVLERAWLFKISCLIQRPRGIVVHFVLVLLAVLVKLFNRKRQLRIFYKSAVTSLFVSSAISEHSLYPETTSIGFFVLPSHSLTSITDVPS